jgi:hypothetical protein
MVCLEVGTVSAGEYFLRRGRGRGCRDLFVGLPGGDLPAAKFFTSGPAHHQVLHPVMAPCTQGGFAGPWIQFIPGARRRTGHRGRGRAGLGGIGGGSVVRRRAGETAPLRARLPRAGGRLYRRQSHFQVTQISRPLIA